MPPTLLWGIRRRFHRLSPRCGHVAHALRTLPPVAVRVLLLHAAPRLACVRPAASVHPEPGSNSSLYKNFYISKLIPDASNFLKKLTLSNLSVFSVLACTCTFLQSFQWTFCMPRFEADCKGTNFFVTCKFIFEKCWIFRAPRSLPCGVFLKAGAKVDIIFLSAIPPANYFLHASRAILSLKRIKLLV